ncbi:MAG: hypothetical protein KGL39_56040 [Patescibacteria group bacterium]|nr:hypothetical protein [Patescibacteria group bacterium]
MSKIVRTPNRVEGGLTEQEKEAMRKHFEKWIAIAMRTDPIEPEKIVPAIKSLYEAAGLKEPRVVIVPSPRVMAFAGGFAAAIWWLRKNPNSELLKDAATYGVTDDATHSATNDATHSATYFATVAPTVAATRDATYDATNVATDVATRAATSAATDAATYEATRAATEDGLSSDSPLVRFFLACAKNWWNSYQGGNMWASYACYLSAFRDVLGLRLAEHAKFASWEQCAMHGGFRWMHDEFCMVSDFPEVLKVDADHRPHCDDGPSHRWRDGWCLWHIHGVAVTEQIVMQPETITIEQVRSEENAEVRRVMIERMGWERFCSQAKMTVIHRDTLESNFPAIPVSETVEPGHRLVVSYRAGIEHAELLESEELKDFEDRPLRFVKVSDPSTGREYILRVLHDHTRCYEALGWAAGMTEKEYKNGSYLRQGDVILQPLNHNVPQQHS